MKARTRTVYWLLWIGLFFVLEFDAIFSKNYAATLTARLREWAAIEDGDLTDGKAPRAGQLRRVALLTGLSWIFWHLISTPGTF